MTVGRFFGKTSRVLAVAAAILAAVGLTAVPRPADAGGGWGGGGHQPWCRCRDRARSFRAWDRAREPLQLQPVLLPVRLLRLLPTGPGLLSTGRLLSAAELLEPLLPLLLRLLSSRRAPSQLPLGDALEPRPLEVVGLDAALGGRPLRH